MKGQKWTLQVFYKVKYKKEAEKFINSNKIFGLKFLLAFDDISKNIENIIKYDIKRLAKDKNIKHDNMYRLRIGKYRAIFEIKEVIKIIDIYEIDSRGGIYK